MSQEKQENKIIQVEKHDGEVVDAFTIPVQNYEALEKRAKVIGITIDELISEIIKMEALDIKREHLMKEAEELDEQWKTITQKIENLGDERFNTLGKIYPELFDTE